MFVGGGRLFVGDMIILLSQVRIMSPSCFVTMLPRLYCRSTLPLTCEGVRILFAKGRLLLYGRSSLGLYCFMCLCLVCLYVLSWPPRDGGRLPTVPQVLWCKHFSHELASQGGMRPSSSKAVKDLKHLSHESTSKERERD